MLIHFAFGSFKTNLQEQADKTINEILTKKRLKISICEEFTPSLHYPRKGAYYAGKDNITVEDNEIRIKIGSVDRQRIDLIPEDKKRVCYIPENIPMICLTETPFNKLKMSPLHHTYGKLGVVFNDSFRRRTQPKKVTYYTEDSLFNDPKVLKFNHLMKINANRQHDLVLRDEINKLRQEILLYRKPASLYPSFHESVVTRVTKQTNETKINVEYWVYNRYKLGYNFTDECEWRIAFPEKDLSSEFLSFEEKDIYAIIVPNSQIYEQIESFLKKTYSFQPKILLHPIEAN